MTLRNNPLAATSAPAMGPLPGGGGGGIPSAPTPRHKTLGEMGFGDTVGMGLRRPQGRAEGGVVGPAHMAEGGRAVDFSGVGKQLEEMLEPVMMKFGGMSVDHNVNHKSMNVTGGDGIGSAIAESVAMKVGGMVEGMIDGALGQLEQRPDGGIYRNKMS